MDDPKQRFAYQQPRAVITMITGGARSGKSRYAAEQALSLLAGARDEATSAPHVTARPLHVATARIWDEEFRARVDRHRAERGPLWECFEEEKFVSRLPLRDRVCVIDCVTLWLTNFFVDERSDIARCLDAFRAEVDALSTYTGHFLIVTNEIGMGIHADTESGRRFTDLQGWANQYLATRAERVVLMVSGIPVTIKPVV